MFKKFEDFAEKHLTERVSENKVKVEQIGEKVLLLL
jgi:hypothetical protein